MNKTMSPVESKIYHFSQSFNLNEQDIITKLASENSWEARYRAIMLLGKQLPNLDDDLKHAKSLVNGCESNVWLNCLWHEDTLFIAASSDAKIVKGLVAVVLAAFNQKTKVQIQGFDVDKYFEQLQLAKNLSPSRTNGLYAIVNHLKTI